MSSAAAPDALRVLVVEPAAPVRRFLVEALEEIGRRRGRKVSVREAADAFETLWLLPRAPADLVLLSLELPTLSGLDLLRILRSRPDDADLPIVALSAELGEGAAETVGETGASAFLPAPVDADRLERALTRAGALGEA